MFIIAYLTMIIDHIGILFNNIPMRLIGRLSFPLFTYGLYRGFKFTHDKLSYVKRLVLLAFISQVPYMIFLHTYRLNVIFTFLFSILALYIFNYNKYLFLLYLLIISFIDFDYGLYGILIFIVFNFYDGLLMYFIFILLNVIYVFLTRDYLQLFSVFSLFFLSLKDIKFNRFFKYSIYPLQFIILEVLKIWIIHRY